LLRPRSMVFFFFAPRYRSSVRGTCLGGLFSGFLSLRIPTTHPTSFFLPPCPHLVRMHFCPSFCQPVKRLFSFYKTGAPHPPSSLASFPFTPPLLRQPLLPSARTAPAKPRRVQPSVFFFWDVLPVIRSKFFGPRLLPTAR